MLDSSILAIHEVVIEVVLSQKYSSYLFYPSVTGKSTLRSVQNAEDCQGFHLTCIHAFGISVQRNARFLRFVITAQPWCRFLLKNHRQL